MTFVPAVTPPETDAQRHRIPFAVGKRGVLARRDDETGRWRLPHEDDLRALGLDPADAHHLGTLDDAVALAIELPDDVVLPGDLSVLGLRTLVEAFDEETFAVAGRASHVLDWATTSRFCGRCGSATERVRGERCMRCPKCALSLYPRISPAVIVLVRRGEQALLARNARFPLPFYSTLAGFSDVGETLEDTIVREIREEVGIRVKAPRYFGSQPWPFPNSLMIGFTAEWESGDIEVDGDEIAEAAWFSRGELPMVPPPISIARRMIDAWLAERLHF
jgi:NAD+ diphosphatase